MMKVHTSYVINHKGVRATIPSIFSLMINDKRNQWISTMRGGGGDEIFTHEHAHVMGDGCVKG